MGIGSIGNARSPALGLLPIGRAFEQQVETALIKNCGACLSHAQELLFILRRALNDTDTARSSLVRPCHSVHVRHGQMRLVWLLLFLMYDIELEGAGTVILDWGTANGCSRPSLILSGLVSSWGEVFWNAQATIWTSSPVEIDC